ncbi:MAG: nucleoside hydrolase [Luteitalea sp.]|nr:nucleoside hydrolase [Luteitalea sp.]
MTPRFRPSFLLALALIVLAGSRPARSVEPEPVRLVFDTDMGNDVDDAMALGMIHALETRGVCRLLAVTVTKDHPKAAAFVDAVNTFYGRGDIPIGVVRNGVTREQGRYLGLVDDGARHPHDLRSGADAPDAVALLRRTLAAQPDTSVTLVQVGFFTNYVRLLTSPADAISPLSGRELIRKKVTHLSVMAGAFQTIEQNNHFLEYNVVQDIRAAQQLVNDWPTPIVWSGFEIGVAAAYPHASIERDFNYVPHHPIKEAYYLYEPPPHDRPTWDLTAVLAAVRPDASYFTLSATGRVDVADDAFTRFVKDPKGHGRDRFLLMNALQAERVREAFVWLTSAPPAR